MDTPGRGELKRGRREALGPEESGEFTHLPPHAPLLSNPIVHIVKLEGDLKKCPLELVCPAAPRASLTRQ